MMLVSTRSVEAAATERRTRRKNQEARRAATQVAAESIRQAERQAFDDKSRKEIATLLEQAANRIERIRGGSVSYRSIERRLCRVYGVKPWHLQSRSQMHTLVTARYAVAYWARRLTVMSSKEIGRKLGDRDHTTILHGIKRYIEIRARAGRTLPPVERGLPNFTKKTAQ